MINDINLKSISISLIEESRILINLCEFYIYYYILNGKQRAGNS